MSDRLRPDEDHWTIRVRATEALKDRLRELASSERRSLAVFIGDVLQDAVTARSTA
jgi:predicted transcriptional regulator